MTKHHAPPPPNRHPDSAEPAPDAPAAFDRDASNEPLPVFDGEPDVGLSQKGTDADAVLRRETEI